MAIPTYQDPFRPIYESYSVAAWLAAAVLLAGSAWASPFPARPFLACVGFALVMAAVRGWQCRKLWRRRRRLAGSPLTFITFDELKRICDKRPNAIWMGRGFTWSQHEAQLMHEVTRADPERLAPRDDEVMGQRWIHGLGEADEDLWLPLEHNAGHMLLAGTTRAGKAQPDDALVHTPSGWRRIDALAVGDLVTTPDGATARIDGVFPQGERDILAIEFIDGRIAEACPEHLWEIHHQHINHRPQRSRSGAPPPLILSTEELANLMQRNCGRFCVRLPSPVQKPQRTLPIHPYALGVLLGAGSFCTRASIGICIDASVRRRLDAALGSTYTRFGVAQSEFELRAVSDRTVPHPLDSILNELGLLHRSDGETFIPKPYLAGSIDQRLELLRGLLDSVGTVSERSISFSSTSPALCEGVRELVWSLGGIATLRQRATSRYSTRAATRPGRTASVVSIQHPTPALLFSHAAQQERCRSVYRGADPKLRLAVAKITKVRRAHARCLHIDHPKHLYITNDYVVTHNTRMLDLMISQAIIRRECVIIFDPKGDKDLRLAAEQACRALGRTDAFVHFHPAFPSQSVRIDPLRNFNRSTEIATRIATLIPSETGADPFAAFGQMALNNVVQGLLLIDAKPNLIVLRRYLEGGPASLLVRACQAYFEKKLANWQDLAKPYLSKVKGASDEDLAPAYIQFYRDKLQPNTSLSSSELEGLMGSFEHDRVHLGKMLTSLMPVLNMLTTGELGRLLSPDVNDVGDPRDVTDFQRIIRNCQVCYIGLDSLSDSMIGSAIGSLLLADLVAVAGARYNYGQSPTSPGGAEPKLAPVNIFIDEAAEIINDPFVQLLNKGGGALMRCICAAQTFADFAARIGSEHKARMILGNLNNLCAMRVIDGHTQKYITESFPETVLQTIERAHSNNASSEDPLRFSGGASERLAEKEAPLVPPALLGCLPNLENFMRVSAGRILKGRVPILVKGTA